MTIRVAPVCVVRAASFGLVAGDAICDVFLDHVSHKTPYIRAFDEV